MKKQRLTELFAIYLQNSISQAEEMELTKLLTDPELESELQLLLEEWMEKMPETHQLNRSQADIIFGNITNQQEKASALVRSINNSQRFWWAAAAVVLVILGGASYFLFSGSKNESNPIVIAGKANDRAAGSFRATLTLANGSKITLDSAKVGLLTKQGNTSITKLNNGELAYNTLSEKPTEEINTLTTPIGGQYKLNLPDGSQAWLNAASSIKYPTAFSGRDRKVIVTGEVYFEVAKNAAKPFIVTILSTVNRQPSTVEVLGTHFNINAYPDEESQKITLLEGAVRVSDSLAHMDLAPGQQAEIDFDEHMALRKAVDTDNIVSWKDGYFNFQRTDIQTIMRQISRWYDVEVVYVGQVTKRKFTGVMSREKSLKEVLTIMEAAGIKFRLEGKKIYVQS